MDSKVAEDQCNTETEEGTIAPEKKRRRVSFAADITTVRFFDRDDEDETPTDPKPGSNVPELAQSKEDLGFRYCEDAKEMLRNEEDEGDEDDEPDARRSFFRPIESPSPGSTIGSATSNEDNFFGPVSTSFIRPGRLSDSAASDEHNDITMDSTAFSMHFRSLARSESGGELKTPTGLQFSFEEKTPSQNTVPCNLGSSMEMTAADNSISASSTSLDKLSSSSYSNDMSLVGQYQNKYDYGRLSPRLDALLAEGSKVLHSFVGSDNITITKSQTTMKGRISPPTNHNGPLEPNGGKDKEMDPIDTSDMPAEAASFVHKRLGIVNGGYNSSPGGQIANRFSYDVQNEKALATDAPLEKQNWSPNQLTKGMLSGNSKDSAALEIKNPNLECNAITCITPPNVDNELHLLDLVAPRECESPLAKSMSSLPAKQRRIVLGSASPLKSLQISTPFPKQPGSFIRDDTRIDGETILSIQKSISKLKVLEASPFASVLKDHSYSSSTLQSSAYVVKTPPPYDCVMDGDRENAQIKCVDFVVQIPTEKPKSVPSTQDMVHVVNSSIVCDDQVLIPAQENGDSNMAGFGVQTSENNVYVRHSKGPAGVATEGVSPGYKSSGIRCREPIKPIEAEGLSSQFTWSGKMKQKNLLTSGDMTKGMFVTSGVDSSIVEIMVDHVKDKKVTGTPQINVDSPQITVDSPKKTREKTSLASPTNWSSPSRYLWQYDQDNKISSIDPGHDADSKGNVGNASLLTTIANLDTFFPETTQPSTPVIEINQNKELSGAQTTDGRETNLHAQQDESRAIGNFQTPLTDKETRSFQSVVLDRDLQIGAYPARFKDNTGRGIGASPQGFASPFVHRNDNELSNQIVVGSFTQSPSRRQNSSVTHNDRSHSFVTENVLSPSTSQPRNELEKFSLHKRRDDDFLDARRQNSPKLPASEGYKSELLSEYASGSNPQISRVGCETRLVHWTDVFSKLSADTKQLISPSTDKLNLEAIGALEDVLFRLQRLQLYELLCSEIQSQKPVVNLSDLQFKRLAETKVVLHRFVNEQAKLQLLCAKRERLRKKVQLLRNGIQESQMLKLNSLPRLPLPCARDAYVDKNSFRSSVNFEGIQEEEDASDRVSALKEVLDASERKVWSLTQYFHTYCKIKGEPSCRDTILFVNDQLRKKACCRFIRLDLQLWEVDSVDSMNGHRNIVLNYLGIISQRLTINVGLASSMAISNKLNDANILKNFPNMDVCTAFAFVLDANTSRKYDGSRSLTQETQITSSVLGNLLDVVEELQVARVELQTLTYTSFRSPSAEKLELHLHFIDLKSGRKVALTLDLSCLKWGIYPSEIMPSHESEGTTIASPKALPDPLSAEIRTAVEGLGVGYSRIVRICRSASKLVQAWSG